MFFHLFFISYDFSGIILSVFEQETHYCVYFLYVKVNGGCADDSRRTVEPSDVIA